MSNNKITETNKQIGANLKRLRLLAGLSQKQISGILGITYQQVQKYETGKSRLSIMSLHTLQQFYDVPFESFFDGIKPDLSRSDYSILPRQLPEFDDDTIKICRQISKIKDKPLKKKIIHIINILVA